METIEIARRAAEIGGQKEACAAYALVIHQGAAPEEELEAAAYILQAGGDYRISYNSFLRLYGQGHFQSMILPVLTDAFYTPNVKDLQGRYERNCRLLEKYPYLFRKDFLPFEDLPIRFYPFDDDGYVPFYPDEARFGTYTEFEKPEVTHYFFKDLDKPVLGEEVYSQYELEYLNDTVRKSEFVGRENHIYLHYADWGTFCAYLQCLNMRPLLEDEKFVFLIGEEERALYPIDFKARYGIDYEACPRRPVGIREINRLIWHTQLSTHNGGDYFNEIFDGHPNLLFIDSVMFHHMEENVLLWREHVAKLKGTSEKDWDIQLENPRDMYWVRELCRMPNPSDKDIMVFLYLIHPSAVKSLDTSARIAPAVFFQPHFYNINYELRGTERDNTMLFSQQYDKTVSSPLFRGFKYIKTFTPMRRFTTSHGATVKFMYRSALESQKERETDKTKKLSVVPDAVTQRVLNRSFMVDWRDRLYKDCRLVRFEDAKLNPKATFTALCAFLDIPYTESMTYCSLGGERDPLQFETNARGFDPAPVYRTYDEFVGDSERKYIEYFLRDAYEYYGYDFHYYDGRPVTVEEIDGWVDDFGTIDRYIRETHAPLSRGTKIQIEGDLPEGVTVEKVRESAQDKILDNQIQGFRENRKANNRVLTRSLRFINREGQPLRFMPKLEPDPALLDQPLYH